MNKIEPLIKGDFYESAFGPSVLLVLTSHGAVAWLRSTFDCLASQDLDGVFRLDAQPEVELGASIAEFLLFRVERTPLRHLAGGSGGKFEWSCTAEEGRTAVLLLEPVSHHATSG
ncbi:MAG: hypothetical protein FWD74_01375 [Actinomycetia bacterium]|nr:hypothetical protein [Actinomycetes bacterium]